MVKSKRLPSKTKRALVDLNFSLFRRLASKAERIQLVYVFDVVTFKDMDLKQRIFDCKSCHLKLGRDIHSAIYSNEKTLSGWI